MAKFEFIARTNISGILNVYLPLGIDKANRSFRITIESLEKNVPFA